MVTVYICHARLPVALSTACTLNEYAPAAFGVPDIEADPRLPDIASPGGSAPAETPHEAGAAAPFTFIVALYCWPTAPLGRLAVAMANGEGAAR